MVASMRSRHIAQLVHLLAQFQQTCGGAIGKESTSQRHARKRSAQRSQIARSSLTERDAAGDALKVHHAFQSFANFFAQHGVGFHRIDGVQSLFDFVH